MNLADEMRKGLAYHRSGLPEKAQEIYRKILDADPLHPDALHLSGLIELETGRYQSAVKLIDKAIQIAPGQPVFHNNLGNVYIKIGQIREAVAHYQKAIRLKSDYAEAYYNLANACQQLDRCDEAISYYRRALEAEPDMVAALFNMGKAYRQKDHLDQAMHCYRRVLEFQPDWADAYHEMGDIYKNVSQPEQAICCFQKAVEINPGSWASYFQLGNLYREKNRLEPAAECYRKVLGLNPRYADAYLNLGITYKSMGNIVEGEKCYQQALAISPNFAEAYYNLGNLYQETDRFEAAVRCFRKALHINPAMQGACINLGIAYQSQGRLDAAVECFENALGANPDQPNVLNNLGNVLIKLKRNAEAVSVYQKALEIRPDFSAAYIGIGNALKAIDKIDDAALYYQKALEISPFDSMALFNLGLILQAQGKFQQSREYFCRAIKTQPNLTAAKWHYHLSLPILYRSEKDIFVQREKFKKGLDAIVNSVELVSTNQKKNALDAVCSKTNFYLAYQGGNDRELQTKFGACVSRIMAENFPQWCRPREMPPMTSNGKIRVGYISAHMYSHTVRSLFEGWIKYREPSEYEIYCYCLKSKSGFDGQGLDRYCDHFRPFEENIEAVARQIVSDDLHVLVYLDIGMYAPATALAGLRLAPVQCVTWGHPVTSGLPTIDYFLSSDLMEPEDAEQHYTERLVRLPNLSIVYDRPKPPVVSKNRQAFGIHPNAFVYLSPQSIFKYLPQHDHIFPRIAHQVPHAKFVFLSNTSSHAAQLFKDRLSAAFDREGLCFETFCLILPRLDTNDYLSLNLASDVLLDTLSWSGGKTTLEGIGCGLPVVTSAGELMRGRHSYAMLTMMDIDDTIADDEDDYVGIAVRLANDKLFYTAVKQKIANNSYKIFKDLTAMRALENFFEEVVKG